MGRLLGYEKLNTYRMAMGLGQKTGTELPEENGVMDSPERRALLNQQWYAGYNIQTGIGQNNLFTPLQIAVYTATVANSGTRYRAHFIRSIRDAVTMEPVQVNTPEVLGETGVNQEYYNLVKSAMLYLGTNPNGMVGRYFKNLPVKVGAKTGTSQVVRTIDGVPTKITNGIFISFAPFDKPEIAVIAVGEGCNNSEPTVPIVRDIYAYYFGTMDSVAKGQIEADLLG
jgi:penicillin-binding protein 2